MDWSNLKIGYRPHTSDMKGPADRRRFLFYSRERGLNFELADLGARYDIVFLTSGCDTSSWYRYKQSHPDVKFIFEIIDSYMLDDLRISSFLRGVSRFISRRDSKLYLDYRKAFSKIIGIADAVVCATPLQRKHLQRLNANIHVSLDYFSDDIQYKKTEYNTGDKLKLVWEGQPYTLNTLFVLKDVLQEFRDRVELHVVTDRRLKYPFRIFDRDVERVLADLPCDLVFHEWNLETFSQVIAKCDLAVIPIDLASQFDRHKPENKLLLLWEVGIPVLTTNTPAYQRVMTTAGIDCLCASESDWITKLEWFLGLSEEERQALAEQARRYLRRWHSKDAILGRWDQIFESVMLENSGQGGHMPESTVDIL